MAPLFFGLHLSCVANLLGIKITNKWSDRGTITGVDYHGSGCQDIRNLEMTSCSLLHLHSAASKIERKNRMVHASHSKNEHQAFKCFAYQCEVARVSALTAKRSIGQFLANMQ